MNLLLHHLLHQKHEIQLGKLPSAGQEYRTISGFSGGECMTMAYNSIGKKVEIWKKA